MIRYRTAERADLPHIDALFRASFTATFAHLYRPRDLADFFAHFSPDLWRREMASPGVAFRLAEQDGSLIGYAKIGPLILPVRARGEAIELRQLYLLEHAKGAGVSTALMDWTLATARTRGAHELFLSVFVDNHRAKRFYARYGFEDVGRYEFRVGGHVDEDRLMRLTL